MEFDDNIELEDFGNQTMAIDYTQKTPAEFGASSGTKPDTTMLKREIAGALAATEGVLGARRGISVIPVANRNLPAAVYVHIENDNRATVGVKIIASTARDPSDIIADATKRIADALRDKLGEEPREIVVKIQTSMPKADFNKRYG